MEICIYEKFIDLLECNISRNNLITDVWRSNCCVLADLVLWQKVWRPLVYSTATNFEKILLYSTFVFSHN